MTLSLTVAPEDCVGLLDHLRARIESSGGSVVVLHAPEPLLGRLDVWGPGRGTLPLMREIKRRFDGNRILNPGRFVGGI